MIVTFITGVRMSLDTANKYGWVHDRTIIISTNTFRETVSVSTQLYSEIFILITGVMLIATGLELSRLDTGIHHISDKTNISLASKKPVHWDIWYDPDKDIIGVILDDIGISFPLKMFNKWITEPEVT